MAGVADDQPAAAENVRDRLIGLINSAHTSENAEANELPQAQEILLKRDSSLMPEFFVHMLDFQVARDNRARRFTAGFAELAVRHQPALYLLPCAECLLNLMSDDNAGVLKRAIRSSSEIFRRCLLTMCAARGTVGPMIAKQWTVVSKLKDAVLAKVASETVRSTNDGVRTQAIRFLENVVLMYSDVGPTQTAGLSRKEGQCLQSVPPGHAVLNRTTLREEGTRVLEQMIALLSTEKVNQHLTAGNFQVLVYALGTIVKERVPRAELVLPRLMDFCLTPPKHIKATLGKSMTKAINMVLGSMGKSSDSVLARWHDAIADTLMGKTPSLPPAIDLKIGLDDHLGEGDNGASSGGIIDGRAPHVRRSAQLKQQFGPNGVVDLLLQCFTNFPAQAPPATAPAQPPPGVGEGGSTSTQHPLALLGERLGQAGPQSATTAVPVAVSEAESALTQLRAERARASVARSSAATRDPRKRKQMEEAEAKASEAGNSDIRPLSGPAAKLARTGSYGAAGGGARGAPPPGVKMTLQALPPQMLKAAPSSTTAHVRPDAPAQPAPKKSRPAVMPTAVEFDEIRTQAWLRLLGERCLVGMEIAGATGIRRAQLARIATGQPVGAAFHKLLLGHIAADFGERQELALDWLYHEFASEQSALFVAGLAGKDDSAKTAAAEAAKGRYERVLLLLLGAVAEAEHAAGVSDAHVEVLLQECPSLTGGAIEMLHGWCEDYSKVKKGLKLLKEVIVQRGAVNTRVRTRALGTLLQFTTHAEVSIRDPAIRIVVGKLFYADDEESGLSATTGGPCAAAIRAHATACLDSLLGKPPSAEATAAAKELGLPPLPPLPDDSTVGEEPAKCRLALYFALCTKEHVLLPHVMDVFVGAASLDVKKSILALSYETWVTVGRVEEGRKALAVILDTFPAQQGMPYVLKMLLTLSKNGGAPQSFVDIVKKTYAERVPDVRLLTPFLATHSKEELTALLPKLVGLLSMDKQQGPQMWRDALTQLFSASPCPLAPGDLLFALHQLPTPAGGGPEPRDVAKAIQSCVADQRMFNFQVLAKVLSKLVELSPIPQLFMLTLIASSKECPQLVPTVVPQILKRCVDKKIWSGTASGAAGAEARSVRLLWKGWLRCVRECVRENRVIAILRGLPQPQLRRALRDGGPVLHAAFAAHIATFDAPPPRYRQALEQTAPAPAASAPAPAPPSDTKKASEGAVAPPAKESSPPAPAAVVAPSALPNNDDDDDDDDDDDGVDIVL